METLDHAIFLVSGSILILPPYAEREKNHLNIATFLLPMAGIEPGPPAQQASALFITPLPIGFPKVLQPKFSPHPYS